MNFGTVGARWRSWIGLGLLLGLLNVTCGSRGAPGKDASGAPQGAAARVRSLVDPSRPTLRLVHREGDPAGVVAAAVFTTGGSRGAFLLGHLVRHRLAALQKAEPRVRVFGIGFAVAIEVGTPREGRTLLAALHQALITPVTPGEIAAAGLASRLRTAARPFTRPSSTATCTGEFGAEGASNLAADRAPTLRELEELRQTSVQVGRIGLSALGDPALLERAADAHTAKWPPGGAPLEHWPPSDQVAVRKTAGVFELRISARVADRARALTAGRALRAEDHPAWARLRALDGLLTSGPVTVALRPLGACLSLTVVRQGELPPTNDTIAAAALIVEQEVLRSLRNLPSGDATAVAVTSPEDALDAASLAAWTAVALEPDPQPTRTLIELWAPEAPGRETAAFTDLLERTNAAFDRRKIPTVSRAETGQPESWLLLGTPCGTAPEQPSEAGLRALALESAARAFDGVEGVRLEPWIEARSMGILAHAAREHHESPEQLGERLALAATYALALDDIDGATIASARAEQLTRLGSDPGLDLIVRALTGDQPSLLDPRGLEREVAALSALDVQRARHALTREPLRAAYLASGSSAEVAAARAELARVLAPHRTDVLPCPAPAVTAAPPGSWLVTSVDPEVSSGAFVAVPVSTSAPTGRALEFLLDRDGGYLDQGLIRPELAVGAEAHFWPGFSRGALIVELHAPKQDLERAIAQARGLLASLASGVPEGDARIARAEEAARRKVVRRSPRGRVVELWLGRLPPPPVEADLRALTAQLGQAEHRVVRVDVRAE